MFNTLLKAILGLLALYITKLWVGRKKPLGPLPPGPQPKPIVGNIADLPPPGVQDWKHWLKHKDLYGKLKEPRLTESSFFAGAFADGNCFCRANQLHHRDGTDDRNLK